MDTEEHFEIQHHKQGGYPYTNEGPYYYHTWWESYKGGIKGKLGGLIIGAVIGVVTGLAAAAIVSSFPVVFPTLISTATVGMIKGLVPIMIGGFTAAGMLYGAHEFDTIGKVTGGVAAAQETAENRMKAFERVKFAELKQEIGEVKAMIAGKPIPAKTITSDKVSGPDGDNYRIRHYAKVNPPKNNKYVFWRIAAIGLVVGLAAGALLFYGGLAPHLFEALGTVVPAVPENLRLATSMIAMGAIGASFGINRDIFRKVFDQTDLLLRGLFHRGKSPAQQMSVAQTEHVAHTSEKGQTSTPVMYDAGIQYPASETYHRDKVLAQAKQALLSLDHTKAIPH